MKKILEKKKKVKINFLGVLQKLYFPKIK